VIPLSNREDAHHDYFLCRRDVPVVKDLPEKFVEYNHPPTGTWLIYDDSAGRGHDLIPFIKQPPGVPCIIFSSLKDSSLVSGIAAMASGGKVFYLRMPAWT